MTWVSLVDGITADADELMENFYHVARGDTLPRSADTFVATSSAYDLGSSAYRWNKIYLNEIASTCTVSADAIFNGTVTFSASPQFALGLLGARAMLVCEHVRASGTDGGICNENYSYTATTLNTVAYNNILGATLSSNQITLPAGSYLTSFIVTAGEIFFGNAILFNVTASTTVARGFALGNQAGFTSEICTCLYEAFTLATQSTMELRAASYVAPATYQTTTMLGKPASFGDSEIYGRIWIYQV